MAKLSDLLNGPVPSGYGYIQNDQSGENTYLTPQGIYDSEENMIAPADPRTQRRLNYANPVEMGQLGGAKAYPIMGEANRYQLEDGRTVTMQPAGTQAAQAKSARDAQEWQLKQEKVRAEIAELMARAEGRNAPKTPKPQAEWKYDAGSDQWVSAPSEEFPQGRTTQPSGKVAAVKSMDYVIDQFKPVLESTPQGGFMGVSGMIGRVTDSQAAKRFDNLREQLSTEIRTVYRIPGEGALSDREQAQYGIQLPDVRNDSATNQAILTDLKERTRLRFAGGQGAESVPRSAQPPAQAQQSGNTVILPDGRTKSFPTPAAAAAFRKAAGL